MFQTHAELVGAIEQRFIDGWGLTQSGTINAVAPNKFYSSDPDAFSGFEVGAWLDVRGGLGANNDKLFVITAVNDSVSPLSVTVSPGSVATTTGGGDESVFMWYTPAYFITTDEGGKWVVGELPQDAPYVELEMVGERRTRLAYSPPSWRVDGVLDIRLHIPESVGVVNFDFADRCDAIFDDWTFGSLNFTMPSKVVRRIPISDNVKEGYRTRIVSYNWWAELSRSGGCG